ncbi:MAG: RNA polymerase sigma factor [Limisphaerales bacterium]
MSTSSQTTPESTSTHGEPPSRPAFVTTHWSLVLSARDKNSPQSADALEKLCRVYWYPLYAYVRRNGQSKENAEDLTQAFFARLLEKNFLNAAEPERGRFRSFLLIALKRFLANEWDRVRAQKRGGSQTHVPLDTELAERKFQAETTTGEISPDRLYDRRWALTLLEQTMTRLRAEFERVGKAGEFERLKSFLTADKREIPYATVAAELGMGESALRVAVHRLRRRYRELFREEIAHTLAEGEDIDEELRHLLAVLSE